MQRCGELIAGSDDKTGEGEGKLQEAPPALAMRCHAAMDAVDRTCGRFNIGEGGHCKDEACIAALGSIHRMVRECADEYPVFPAPDKIEQAQAACVK